MDIVGSKTRLLLIVCAVATLAAIDRTRGGQACFDAAYAPPVFVERRNDMMRCEEQVWPRACMAGQTKSSTSASSPIAANCDDLAMQQRTVLVCTDTRACRCCRQSQGYSRTQVQMGMMGHPEMTHGDDQEMEVALCLCQQDKHVKDLQI